MTGHFFKTILATIFTINTCIAGNCDVCIFVSGSPEFEMKTAPWAVAMLRTRGYFAKPYLASNDSDVFARECVKKDALVLEFSKAIDIFDRDDVRFYASNAGRFSDNLGPGHSPINIFGWEYTSLLKGPISTAKTVLNRVENLPENDANLPICH